MTLFQLRSRLEYIPKLFLDLGIGEVIEIESFNQRTFSKTSKFLVVTQIDKYLVKFYENMEVPKFLDFIGFLNSVNFPTNRLITKTPHRPLDVPPCMVYSFLEGEVKSFLDDRELSDFSQIIARLHSESDNFYGRDYSSNNGLTHGDVNLTNIIYNEINQPSIIDFDKINIRNYVYDVASFLFFNTLSDLSYGKVNIEQAKDRGHAFIQDYENTREMKLDGRRIAQALRYQSEQFLKYTRQQLREKRVDEKIIQGRVNLVGRINNLFQ